MDSGKGAHPSKNEGLWTVRPYYKFLSFGHHVPSEGFEDDGWEELVENAVSDKLVRLYEVTHHTAKVRVITLQQAKLEKSLARAFRMQRASFMRGFVKLKFLFPTTAVEARRFSVIYLREAISADNLDPIFDQSDEDSQDAFVKPLEDAVTAALVAAGKQQIAEMGMRLAFDLKNPRAVAYMKAHGADLVAQVNQTTRDYIKSIVTQAAEEGWSYDRAAQAIIDRYEEFAVGVPGEFDSRAQRIAVTELGNAYEEGNFEPIQELMDNDVEMEKKWDVAPELSKSGPCAAICQPNADEGWIPADQEHASGDDHPLGHPGCVCDEYYQVKGSD